MSTYTLTLTPTPSNYGLPTGEGNLDTAILSGVSIQRTGYVEVWKSDLTKRKVIEAIDGESFNDTTFEAIEDVLPLTKT